MSNGLVWQTGGIYIGSMSSIRDRLSRLDKSPPAIDEISHEGAHEAWVDQLRAELDLKVLRHEKSFVLLKENSFPVYQDPEYEQLRERGFIVPALHRITGDPADRVTNLKKALFIDTETTGLAGGTGTYAFLIGIGHLELDHIVVRQYLLPDFGHEWLMLEQVDQAMQLMDYTVSFNGKTFDIPLLRNRYVLNRMLARIEDIHHVDILHASRRIWRRRLQACNLQNLERHILGISRVGDIPGEMIPQIYFEFIRKRSALHLRDVLEHNYHDIVNMARLTVRLAAIAEAPLQHLQDARDIFSVAYYFYQGGRLADAADLLTEAISGAGAVDSPMLREAVFLLAMCHKKSGNVDAARAQLQLLVSKNIGHPKIIEELAKIYEHKDKDFQAAADLVEQGLQYLETLRQLNGRAADLKFQAALQHRRRRLLEKRRRQIAKKNAGKT